MFFDFASEHVYADSEWPHIWRIEKIVAAVIQAHKDELVSIPITEIGCALLNRIQELALLDASEVERTEQYLDFQKEAIFAYIQRNRQEFSRNEGKVHLVPHFSEYANVLFGPALPFDVRETPGHEYQQPGYRPEKAAPR